MAVAKLRLDRVPRNRLPIDLDGYGFSSGYKWVLTIQVLRLQLILGWGAW